MVYNRPQYNEAASIADLNITLLTFIYKIMQIINR